MSLEINTENVQSVLLADGWHDVSFYDGISSFDMDSYEYIHGEQTLLKGGSVEGVPTTGVSWNEITGTHVHRVCAPVTAILAIKETGSPLTKR